MNAIRTAIYSKFTANPANSFYTGLGGKLYYAQSPQVTSIASACPYAVFYILSDTADWTFREKFDYYTVQFSLYDTTATLVETHFANLISLYDDAVLSITGFSHVWCKREMATGAIWFQDDQVWQLVTRYSMLAQDT
jgi:hypothetical protein